MNIDIPKMQCQFSILFLVAAFSLQIMTAFEIFMISHEHFFLENKLITLIKLEPQLPRCMGIARIFNFSFAKPR